jgi:acetyl esterase/lipase
MGGTGAAENPEGLLVYFHGGGFVVCDLRTSMRGSNPSVST